MYTQDKDTEYEVKAHPKKVRQSRDSAMALLMESGVLAESEKPRKRRNGNYRGDGKSHKKSSREYWD